MILASTSGRMGIILRFIIAFFRIFLMKTRHGKFLFCRQSETFCMLTFYIEKKVIPLRLSQTCCQKEISGQH